MPRNPLERVLGEYGLKCPDSEAAKMLEYVGEIERAAVAVRAPLDDRDAPATVFRLMEQKRTGLP